MVDKAILIQRLRNLENKKCYIKLFRMIIQHNIKYTKNQNGIFFNIDLVDNNTLTEMDKLITYYEKKKTLIYSY